MTLSDLIRLLLRNWLLLTVIPVVTAISVFFFSFFLEKEYASETIIYTGIASGYGVKGDKATDYFAANNAFDNILTLISSRDTKEEIALRLLADHLVLQAPDPAQLSRASFDRLQELMPPEVREKLVAPTAEGTYHNLEALYKSGTTTDNAIYKLLNSEKEAYSLKALSNIFGSRVGSSDLIKITYHSNDPAMCKRTLELLTQVFLRKHKALQEGQTASVAGYFEEETQRAFKRLAEAEQKYIEFNTTHNIINYPEQAKTTTAEKQEVLNNYNELEMQYAGALSSARAIEKKLAGRGAMALDSQEMLEKRNQLSRINFKIAELEMYKRASKDASTTNRLAQLKQEADGVSRQIKASGDKYFANTQSVEGVPVKGLLEEWVKSTMALEESKAKLQLMTRRKNSFMEEYGKMAPLGATLRKIEREIDVAEKEYLSMLNGMNQSKLAQQNIELSSSSLTIMDPPFLPYKPVNSKRILLVLLGAFGSFFLTAGGVIGADLLDNTLKRPAKAPHVVGLPLFGTLPVLYNGKASGIPNERKVGEQLARQLLLRMHQNQYQQGPFVVGVISGLVGEGKTTVSALLAHEMRRLGIETMVLHPDNHSQCMREEDNQSFYAPLEGVSRGTDLQDVLRRWVAVYPLVIIEFPAVLEATYPVGLLKHLDLVLVTVQANRVWQPADQAIFENIGKLSKGPLEVVLNGVRPEYIEILPTVRQLPASKTRLAEANQPRQPSQKPVMLNS